MHTRNARWRAAAQWAVAALAGLGLSGCSPSSNIDVDAPLRAYASDRSEIQVVTTVIGGKNVFIPSTIVVTGGRPHTLSIYNTSEKAHGFAIPGLGVEETLLPGMEHKLELPSLEGGRVLAVECQLHPAHRRATLLVVPGS